MTFTEIQSTLEAISHRDIAAHSARFFKTGPGEYGEGDRFRGIRVPPLRKLARSCKDASAEVCEALLASPWHEDRLLALLILVIRYERGDARGRQAVFDLYRKHVARVNNWDLVDVSAPRIVGPHLEDTPGLLFEWAGSDSLWERRIAVVATYPYIKGGRFREIFVLADLLLDDEEDLVHKAVGWMLREVGKKDRKAAEGFLRTRYRRMPRTMLRYAIERYEEATRHDYLKGRI